MQSASVHELELALKSNSDPSVDFINVCTPAEYAAAHIPGVRSVPLDSLESHLSELRAKKRIYVHCRSGGRSRIAINVLRSLGISGELINVEGGIMAWAAAGKPMGRK